MEARDEDLLNKLWRLVSQSIWVGVVVCKVSLHFLFNINQFFLPLAHLSPPQEYDERISPQCEQLEEPLSHTKSQLSLNETVFFRASERSILYSSFVSFLTFQ
jgi:hypothetical protein